MLWRSGFCIPLWYRAATILFVRWVWNKMQPCGKQDLLFPRQKWRQMLGASLLSAQSCRDRSLAFPRLRICTSGACEWSWGLTFIWLFYRLHFLCCWGSTQLKLHYWCLSHIYLWQGQVWFFLFTVENFTLQQTWFGASGFLCILSFIGVCSRHLYNNNNRIIYS